MLDKNSILLLGWSSDGDYTHLRVKNVPKSILHTIKVESDKLKSMTDRNYVMDDSSEFGVPLPEPIELTVGSIVHTFETVVNFNLVGYDNLLMDYDLTIDFKELVKMSNLDFYVVGKKTNDKVNKRKKKNRKKKDGLKMMNLDNNNLGFDKVEGLVGISVLDGKVAHNLNGKWVTLGLDNSLVDVTGFVKELDMDSMILPMAVSQIQVGDLIIIEDQPVLVIGNQNGEIKTTNGDGEIKSVVPTINQLYGGAIVKKVFNPLINTMGGGNSMLGGQMNPMMLMMMMNGDSDNGSNNSLMETMLMMSMFQQNNGMGMGMGMNNGYQQPMNMGMGTPSNNQQMNPQQPMTNNPQMMDQQVQGWSQPITPNQQPTSQEPTNNQGENK